jgi:hypothetical protein
MAEIYGNTTTTPIEPDAFKADKMDKFAEIEKTDMETILRVLTSAFEIDGKAHLRLKGGQILLEAGNGTIKFVNGEISTNEDEFSFVSANDYMESIPIKVGEPTKPEHSATKNYVDTAIGIALNTEV